MDNQKPGPSKRVERAKSELTPSRSNESFKNKIRQRFAERMKISRSKSIDQFRQILQEVEEKVPYQSVDDLRNILLGAPEGQYLLGDKEISKIMEEVEKELNEAELEKEGVQQDTISEMETDDIVDRHLSLCILCNKVFTDAPLCPQCCNNLFTEL